MKETRLCIAYPNKLVYSETFIQNHLKYLEPIEKIYGGWYPIFNSNGECILKFPLNKLIVRGILKRISSKSFHNIYTQYFSKFLYKNNINVVLAEYGITGVSVLDSCRNSNIPLIVHFHGFDAFTYSILKKYKKQYDRLFEIAKIIIVGSNTMVEQLLFLGAKKEKIILNPYGVDNNKFSIAQPEKNPLNFVSIGRFTEKKAPDLVIKSFKIVTDLYPNAKLKMIGDGHLLKKCKKLSKKLNLQKNISFLGIQNEDQIVKHLQNSRGFIQHSIKAKDGDMEGTGVTILEACSMAIPVVSTFHSGIKDSIIHNKTGLLVEEGDYKKMAEYIIRLIKEPNLSKSLGLAGRQRITKEYNLEKRINNLKDIIKKVVDNI